MQKKQYYDSQYEIWEDGTCINIITNHILKPQMTSHYPTYNLTLNGKKKKIKIHRMVAEMFLPRKILLTILMEILKIFYQRIQNGLMKKRIVGTQ